MIFFIDSILVFSCARNAWSYSAPAIY
jgi:hypothetical protein